MSTFNQALQVGANWFVLRHGLAAPRNLEAVVGAGPVVDLTWTPAGGWRTRPPRRGWPG